ncbi:MAG: arginine--tRNA ligase [Fastidiosipilaceae bacterium]|nr:arginine--tRNA ligase [Clostridiaceae bacterium]
MDFVAELSTLISQETDLSTDIVKDFLEVPPQPELGDYALPCFKLAKTMRKAPNLIAEELAEKMQPLPDYLTEVRQTGGYLNFFINRSRFIQDEITSILHSEQEPGVSDLGKGQTILVEFSSPNIAKPFHIGHGFTTILGESLARIYDHLGYDTKRLNHLGDYGTQFGKLIVAYDRWGNEEELLREPIDELLRIYVKFHDEAEQEIDEKGVSILEKEAREAFQRLEAGAEHETQLWSRFREVSLIEFNRVYDRLGIKFDNLNGESFYSDQIPAVVEMLKEKNLLEESEGAQVVRLDEFNLPPCIILKSDGTTIYASRDIAAVLYRDKTWNFNRNIYVVGLPQQLHFKQIFAVLKKAGEPCADRCEHVGFGTVKFPDGALSTRSGKVIKLDDLFAEAVKKTRQIIETNATERGDDMSAETIDAIAEKVGLGAILYIFLKNGRERDIVFKWEEVLDFDGDTAPYLQYTYARAKSILRRANEVDATADPSTLELAAIENDTTFQLVRAMADFPEAIQNAASANEPFMIARQINLIARLFNKFYNNDSILNIEDTNLRQSRLCLCRAVCRVLKTGLNLLGIEAVEKM